MVAMCITFVSFAEASQAHGIVFPFALAVESRRVTEQGAISIGGERGVSGGVRVGVQGHDTGGDGSGTTARDRLDCPDGLITWR